MNRENLCLKEPDINPTTEVISTAIGDSFVAYETLQESLANLELEQEWKYYPGAGCGKCWLARGQYFWKTERGTNKEKTIYWLSAWNGYFNVAIWFLAKNRAEILNANLSEETKNKIRDAKTLGKMNTFPVEFQVTKTEQLNDIYSLINYKKRLEAK